MSVEALGAWLLSVMLSAVPPGSSRFPKEAVESPEAGRARYEAIARTVARVAFDEAEKPLYEGPRARERTAALLLALAYHESSFRRDVDFGIGPQAHGGGPYHCLLQIRVDERTPDGWTGRDLVADREKCFRAGLHLLQRSRKHCKKQGPDAWLRLYASGHCTRGRVAVEKRLDTLARWLKKHPFEPAEPGKRRPEDEKARP
jgi:hypothetical protein